MAELGVGDRVLMTYGPYVCYATVVEITDRGAILKLPARAILHEETMKDVIAPNGDLLASAPHTFLGRAHWNAANKGVRP